MDNKMKASQVMKFKTPEDLKNFRFMHNRMKQSELAILTGYSLDAVGSMERGNRNITKSFLLHLKEAIEEGKLEAFMKKGSF